MLMFLTFLPSYHGYSFVLIVSCWRTWKLLLGVTVIPFYIFKQSTFIVFTFKRWFKEARLWIASTNAAHISACWTSKCHQYYSASLWCSAATGAPGTESSSSVLLNSDLENSPHFECLKPDVCCLPASSSSTSSVGLSPQIKDSRQQSNNTECCPPSGMKGNITVLKELGLACDLRAFGFFFFLCFLFGGGVEINHFQRSVIWKPTTAAARRARAQLKC